MNKLEKHIKTKLAEREINPSEGAWSQVASGLSKPTKKTSGNRTFWYYAIAASFVGLLALGIFYTTPDNGNDVLPPEKVATTLEDKVVAPPLQTIDKATEIVHSDLTIEKTRVSSIKKQLRPEPLVSKAAKNPSVLEDFPKLDQVVIEDITAKEEVLIAEKLDAVLAKVSNMESGNTLVTDAEVDSLLRIAQQEILTDRVLQQNGKVDAMALLDEVEGELDKTFRDQLFEKLKDGFFKVRTAVADRNN